MLDHVGLPEFAAKIHNSWLYTLEEGIHTYDIFKERISKQKVGTQEFAKAVIKNLGKMPKELKPVAYHGTAPILKQTHLATTPLRLLVGVDVYLYYKGRMEEFFSKISHINIGALRLKMITNRGTRVWPQGQPETFCIEQWRCRFLADDGRIVSQSEIIQVLHAFDHVQMDVIQSQSLYTFDGKPGYSSAEG